MTTINVYIPTDPTNTAIDPASGIVGTPDDTYLPRMDDNPRVVRIDYEGNRFNAVNIVTWADRCYHAAGRHLANYPTIARAWVEPDTMVLVGELDMETGVVIPAPGSSDRISVWLGTTDLLHESLTTNHRHQEKRHDHDQHQHPRT